jgi:putative Holliday junction resolvase
MRALGVDLGRSRTGLALSDPYGISCTPLEVLAERNEDELLQKIVQIAEDHQVVRIVVGLPRPLAGGTNRQSEEVKVFVEALSRRSSVPVAMWDERFTSKLAEGEEVPRKARDRPRDSIAACYMLQSYLDSQASRRRDI